MIFAAILAGGSGTRMGNQDRPKQYLLLNEKPIITYTVEKFLAMPEFDSVIVLCPNTWIETTKDVLEKELGAQPRLRVISGGDSRTQTIMNAISFIEENFETAENDVIVTHDAVRPFVTYRIIKENIGAMSFCEACDTVIPATDTIVESRDGKVLSSIPNRNILYQGQTPQTFKIAKLKKLFAELADQQKLSLTDACGIFTASGEPVAIVDGETFNMKITYPSDLRMAHALLGVDQDA